jgi:beta-N-acetylhexosaminidase
LKYLNAAFVLARITLIVTILPFCIGWRTPLFAGWRTTVLVLLLALPAVLVVFEIWWLRHNRSGPRALRLASFGALALAAVAFGTTASLELNFQYKRHAVLSADAAQLQRLGAHILVGYRSDAMLQALMERRALAGVFISARNVEGMTVADVRDRIAALQATRRQQGLPPLWIATDQEGGPVSRLSPPLMRQSTLAEIVALHRDPSERLLAIRQYAGRQGRELASLGVNLNFSPVVDLNHGVQNPDDRLTRIATRAISSDPKVVTQVADLYCATLKMTGVHCTLKHFPGLGRVYDDTHKVTAELDAPSAELERSDWLPFRQLMADDSTFTMLSHARLSALDPDRPTSFSQAVVKGLLRETWKHDGILVTDDFSMGAVTLSREGAAGGAIAALNAGVDLILVSYDPDQYFYVMHALLAADRDGKLRADMLERSGKRLTRAAQGT